MHLLRWRTPSRRAEGRRRTAPRIRKIGSLPALSEGEALSILRVDTAGERARFYLGQFIVRRFIINVASAHENILSAKGGGCGTEAARAPLRLQTVFHVLRPAQQFRQTPQQALSLGVRLGGESGAHADFRTSGAASDERRNCSEQKARAHEHVHIHMRTCTCANGGGVRGGGAVDRDERLTQKTWRSLVLTGRELLLREHTAP